MHVTVGGLPSRTEFEVLGRRRAADGAPVALVACHPRTGRQHQIRAHLHHAGLHLVGDKIYGPDEMIFDRFTKREMTEADHALLRLPRQALHAWRLSLPHPETGERLDLEAPARRRTSRPSGTGARELATPGGVAGATRPVALPHGTI